MQVDDRRRMQELMPFMLKEAQRRDMLPDVVVVDADEGSDVEPLAIVTPKGGEDIPFTDQRQGQQNSRAGADVNR